MKSLLRKVPVGLAVVSAALVAACQPTGTDTDTVNAPDPVEETTTLEETETTTSPDLPDTTTTATDTMSADPMN